MKSPSYTYQFTQGCGQVSVSVAVLCLACFLPAAHMIPIYSCVVLYPTYGFGYLTGSGIIPGFLTIGPIGFGVAGKSLTQ